MSVADEAEDEISGANVVSEIAEEWITEGIIAKVLNGAAAVGVGVGFVDLRIGEVGILVEQEWTNRLLPGEIDELFVSLDGVGTAGLREEKEKHEREGFGAEVVGLRSMRGHEERITASVAGVERVCNSEGPMMRGGRIRGIQNERAWADVGSFIFRRRVGVCTFPIATRQAGSGGRNYAGCDAPGCSQYGSGADGWRELAPERTSGTGSAD